MIYNSFLQVLSSSEENMFIVRQDPKKKTLATKEQTANKVNHLKNSIHPWTSLTAFFFQILPTSTNKNAQYVHPEAVNGFLSGSSKKPQKRPLGAGKTVDVPLELRLENLAVDVPSTVSAPTSESLVHLLLQVRIRIDSLHLFSFTNFSYFAGIEK